jgi:Protein of unknown function (DUF2505)
MRSFDVLLGSPASVEQVHAAFTSEEYWRARHAIFDAGTTLDSLIVDADGTVTMQATQHVGRQLLPRVVAGLISGDLQILHNETWRPVGDRRVQGRVSVTAPLVSGRATALLEPVANGSQLTFTANVEVRIPLVGGKFEGDIGADLANNITEIQRFTTTWITKHA